MLEVSIRLVLGSKDRMKVPTLQEICPDFMILIPVRPPKSKH